MDLTLGGQRFKIEPQGIPLCRGQLFGIIDPAGIGQRPAALQKLAINQDRRGDHGPGQRPAPGLIHSGQTVVAVDLLQIESAKLTTLGHQGCLRVGRFISKVESVIPNRP